MSSSRTTRPTSAVGGEQPAPQTYRSVVVRAAGAAAALFAAIASFHAAVAFGAPWGEYTQGGGISGTLATSGRLVAAASCVLSVVMAVAILGRVGRGPWGRRSTRVTTVLAWFALMYAATGLVLNLITRSTGERALWAPVSAVLLGLVAFVMITSHRDAVGPTR